jgi:hypothetical protein
MQVQPPDTRRCLLRRHDPDCRLWFGTGRRQEEPGASVLFLFLAPLYLILPSLCGRLWPVACETRNTDGWEKACAYDLPSGWYADPILPCVGEREA